MVAQDSIPLGVLTCDELGTLTMREDLARRSETGELYLHLARSYLIRHEWGKARIALEKGLHKGKLEDPGNAQKLREQIYHCLGVRVSRPT